MSGASARRGVRRRARHRRTPVVTGSRGSVVVTGIGELTTQDPDLGTVRDAAVVAEGDTIVWVGPAARAPAADRRIDVGGRAVVPGFVDSHTHLVFAGDRAGEFAARMRGERYDGGGIASTVAATRAADDVALRALLAGRIAELRAQGTTTVEIKSGYGLTVADEERALRLAAEVTAETTFLGAHVVPEGVANSRRARAAGSRAPLARLAPSTSPWSSVRCSPPARRTPAGSTSSASPRARTPSTATRPARCSRPGARRGWACGCTGTSSAPDRGSRWPSSWARRASTTART